MKQQDVHGTDPGHAGHGGGGKHGMHGGGDQTPPPEDRDQPQADTRANTHHGTDPR